MKAIWNGQVIAEADKDDLIYIEQNWYFPPSAVKQEFLRKSDTPYTCPWKGVCQYYDVGRDGPADGQTGGQGGDQAAGQPDGQAAGQWSKDNAWSYPEPLPTAIERVHKDFSGYIAFWRDVTVGE